MVPKVKSAVQLVIGYLALRGLAQEGTGPESSQLTVETTNGPIIGHLASNASDVLEFLGIPYAQPPTGDLRFAPPARYSGNSSYNASNWGFDCPQSAPGEPTTFPQITPQGQDIIVSFAGDSGNMQSEDCLTLNVWTRSNSSSADSTKPVLVFFHGGRFTFGKVDDVFYNGRYLAAAEEVVVVTLTYRMNIFGFPGTPDEPQNVGLRDQRTAVEWVRDNIAGFGGDPTKITIFGQSAGGVAVDYWSYTYASDPIVNGLIMQSGNAFSFPVSNASTAATNWYNVSDQLGCGSEGNTLDCMRTKDWEEIMNITSGIKGAYGGSPLRTVSPFYPTIDNEFVYEDYTRLARNGLFAKIPILIGNNNHEQGFYNITAWNQGLVPTVEEGDAFLLQSFTCPAAYEADARQAQGVPVWRYRYFGDWNNTRLYPTSGTYHGSELMMIYNSSQDVTGNPPSEDEIQTVQVFQRAWVAFANNPTSGLTDELGWPSYDKNNDTLVRLAFEDNPEPDFVSPSLYDAACSTVQLGAMATGS